MTETVLLLCSHLAQVQAEWLDLSQAQEVTCPTCGRVTEVLGVQLQLDLGGGQ